MGTFRLYTGPDGQGRIDKIDIEKKDDWLKGLPTTQISFSVWPVGRFLDWHPAPRRQFVVILSGQLEIGLGDGSSTCSVPAMRAWSRTPPVKATPRAWSARSPW